MPYVNDPFELALRPQRYSEIEEEERPSWADLFFDETAPPSVKVVSAPDRAYTEMCRFDEDGNHTVMADHCPHYDTHDEEGRIIRRGWTAQNA